MNISDIIIITCSIFTSVAVIAGGIIIIVITVKGNNKPNGLF